MESSPTDSIRVAEKTADNKIADIQILRGVSIVLTILCHLSLVDVVWGAFPVKASAPFWMGVPIFFVISGYVIARSLMKDGCDAIHFVVRRVLRLLPTMLLLLATACLLNALCRGLSFSAECQAHEMCGDWPHFLRHCLGAVLGYGAVPFAAGSLRDGGYMEPQCRRPVLRGGRARLRPARLPFAETISLDRSLPVLAFGPDPGGGDRRAGLRSFQQRYVGPRTAGPVLPEPLPIRFHDRRGPARLFRSPLRRQGSQDISGVRAVSVGHPPHHSAGRGCHLRAASRPGSPAPPRLRDALFPGLHLGTGASGRQWAGVPCGSGPPSPHHGLSWRPQLYLVPVSSAGIDRCLRGGVEMDALGDLQHRLVWHSGSRGHTCRGAAGLPPDLQIHRNALYPAGKKLGRPAVTAQRNPPATPPRRTRRLPGNGLRDGIEPLPTCDPGVRWQAAALQNREIRA